MNKKIGVGIFGLLIISVLILNLNFASAEIIDDINSGWENVYDFFIGVIQNFLQPIAEALLINSGENVSSDLLFAKLLFLLIILGVIHFSFRRVSFFEDQGVIYGIIIFGISILATRWLGTEDLLKMIILPYSVLGIAISAGLPFIVYFLFIEVGFKNTEEHDYTILRKIAWVLFIVIFIGLWYSRSATIQDIGRFAKYVYPVTLLAAAGVLLFDRRIQEAWHKGQLRSTFAGITSDSARELRRQLYKLGQDLQNNLITTQQYQAGYKKIKAQLKALGFKI